MKKLLLCLLAVGLASTATAQDGGCLTAENGQYPEFAFTPQCTGNFETITDAGFSSEYSVVNVIAGMQYHFKSSLPTDFITISSADATLTYAHGLDTVTWIADISQEIRFYVHTNENCDYDYDSLKHRLVKCEGLVPDSYCEPILDCTDGASILNVNFAGIVKESDCATNGFNDFTDNIMMAEMGQTYPISVEVGYGWYEQSLSMWIDFNENFIFEEDEFFFIGEGTNTTINSEITIPTDILPGKYRMRLRLATVAENLATWDKACDVSQFYGETEDYSILITEESMSTAEINKNTISVYPNPVQDFLNIQTNSNVKSVVIANLEGKVVINSTQSKINMSHLNAGIYIARIELENGEKQTIKVVKK